MSVIKTEIPVYGTIPRTGKEWTVKLMEITTETGSTINGSISGYGPFPYERFPGLPIINFSGHSFNECLEALIIFDQYKPHMGIGKVSDLMVAFKNKGFEVMNFAE